MFYHRGQTTAPPPVKAGEPLVKEFQRPLRYGFGSIGREILIIANYLSVDTQSKDGIYEYDLTISPEVTSRTSSRDIKQILINDLGLDVRSYDGKKSVYAVGLSPFDSNVFEVFIFGVKHEFKLTIKSAAIVRRSLFHIDFGRGPLGDGVEYWKGFYLSLRPTQMGLSLNIDMLARAFIEPKLLSMFVGEFRGRCKKGMFCPLSHIERIKLMRALKGVTVEVRHQKYKRRYKVQGLTTQPISQLEFTDKTGAIKTVPVYFKEKYNVTLRFLALPAIQAGTDAHPIYLPMEICWVIPGQRYALELNERQVTQFLRATCQRPDDREASIYQTMQHNQYQDEVRKVFEMNVIEVLPSIKARVLPPPQLRYHASSEVTPSVGVWNMTNLKVINGGTVEYWTVINLSQNNVMEVGRFVYRLLNTCRTKGIKFHHKPLIPMYSAMPHNIEETLADLQSRASEKLAQVAPGQSLQMLFVILPESKGAYPRIKRVCETELGIVSQCCKPHHVFNMDNQYFENIALKINVKVGGRNTVLSACLNNKLPIITDRPTIIFGACVTHPQPGEDSIPSIAAVVASMDWPEVTKYKALVSAQPPRQEIIQDLYTVHTDPKKGVIYGGLIRELLISFKKETGRKPHRLIFYRDGVSEDQFSEVLLNEMDKIRKACLSLEENYMPPVTFIVAQKRHHTRFFPARHDDRANTDRSGNILAGTVVDTKICHSSEFDFYLCSHAGIQGTSRPTHYHVLYDENKFTPDGLQMLTNSLCYTYARCTRSVSIVPPAYYARLAALRARAYIEGDKSDTRRATIDGFAEVHPLPVIHDKVRSVMFYC